MKLFFETRSSVFKAVLLSFALGMSAGVINFLSALSAEFKIEQQRQNEISDLDFKAIVALAKSSNGNAAELEKFAGTVSVLKPSQVGLDISVAGQTLVRWEQARQISSRPILDILTERWITYERMDAETGVFLRGVKDSHIAYRYFVDRQWINARTALLRTLLIMAVVWACIYLLLARPLRKIRVQINSPKFLETGITLGDEVGAEFIDLADGINDVLARDQLLRKRNRRLFKALMATRDACVIYTAKDGLAIFINHAGMEILGGKREDWIGTPIYEMSSNTNIDTYRATQQQLAKNGSHRYVRKVISDAGENHLFDITTTQTMIDGEKINTMMVRPLDVPESAIKQSQVNDLRRIIGGIAHELNNSLQVIRGKLELELENTPFDTSASGNLRQAAGRISEVDKLISRLMTYAQVSINESSKIIVDEMLSLIVDEQSAIAPQYDIKLSSTGDTHKTAILMDKDAFLSVFGELIQNAVEASNPSTLILVSLTTEHLAGPQKVGHITLEQGDYVKIVVGDEGKGMTGRQVSAAFDPFYSVTKDPGRGMGLSAVKSSLEIAGGTIDIESAPGVGTNVTVFLPIAVEHTLKSATTAETYSV